jgi:LEA14-like dessication related protein
MNNPNDFSMELKKITINLTMPDGQSIGRFTIQEIDIPANKEIQYVDHFTISFQGENPTIIKTKASGIFGIHIGLFQKNIPFSFTINSDMMNIINDLNIPTINSQLQFGSINQNEINVSVTLDIYNMNSFTIEINKLSIQLVDEHDNSYCTCSPSDITIYPEKQNIIEENMIISLNALNSNVLFLNSSMNIRAIIAGFVKELPCTISTKINLPDLETLLSSSFPTDVIIRGDYHPSLNGLIDTISLVVRNPNNVEFTLKDIEVHIYRIDNNKRSIIGNGSIASGIIKENTSTILTGEVLIPYTKLFLIPIGRHMLPDWLEVTIRANATIKGLNNYLWVGMIAYQDVHPFRKDPDILDDLELWYE